MTTAHRPTWAPAVGGSGKQEGGLGSLSKQYSVRDQASHTKLKFRASEQLAEELSQDDLRSELFSRETAHREKRKADPKNMKDALEAQEQAEKRLKAIEDLDPNLDADDDEDDDDSSDDDDDSDDEAELQRELDRLKAERAKEYEEREQAKTAEEQQVRNENYMRGNPLLRGNSSDNFGIQKRWDDDVVFKNCARNEKKEQTFINDTLRSEFHRRFLTKYIK